MSDERSEGPGEDPRLVVRDRRRIDPDTGQVRTVTEEVPVDEVGAAEGGKHAVGATPVEPELDQVIDPVTAGAADAGAVQAELDERTADLQRLQAEYANYRKRVDRDREAVVSGAKAQVVGELLSVLDDIERAAVHGDLTGAFKAVADKLITSLLHVGLEPFGHESEPFDPAVHEAVQHSTSPDVPGPTVTAVLRRGYRFGERVVRPALVGVTDHEPAAAAAQEQPIVVDEQADWFEPSDGSPGGEPSDERK